MHVELSPEDAQVVIESPGRINLIGEHLDYNGGWVLPAAIDLSITLYLKANGSEKCHVHSKNYNTGFTIDLNDVKPSKEEWHNYFLGVIHYVQEKFPDSVGGFDCTVVSTLPIGSGVSSSAALECGIAKGLAALFQIPLENIDIIKMAQKAEHNFVGTKCGIMDQFAVVMGKKDHLIYLNCDTLDFEYIPTEMSDYELVLLNTNVSHNLATSEYNVRRHECETGLKKIQERYPEQQVLADVPEAMLSEFKNLLDPKTYNRLLYVIQENLRTKEATKILAAKNFERVGELLYASHHGLSTLYEVSCAELDFLVDYSKQFETVLGGRMMGGGFGGCTINLVKKEATDAFIEKTKKAYHERFSIELSSFSVALGDGVKRIH